MTASVSGVIDDEGNRCGEPLPLMGLFFKSAAPFACERVVLGAPVLLRIAPFGHDPRLLLEFMESRIERPLPHLQDVTGHLADAPSNRPTVHGLEVDDLQNQ